MAGQLKIGGNVIVTHAGSEGAGTVTLDSSTLTIGSNTTISGSTIDSSTTFPAGHILQVQYTSTSEQVASTGSFVAMTHDKYIEITKIAGSNIFLSWSTQMAKSAHNVYANASTIERATNSGFSAGLTSLPSTPQVSATTEPGGSVGYTGTTNYNYTGNWGHQTIDAGITSSAGTYYYRVMFRSNGSTVTSAIDAGVTTFLAMEIKT